MAVTGFLKLPDGSAVGGPVHYRVWDETNKNWGTIEKVNANKNTGKFSIGPASAPVGSLIEILYEQTTDINGQSHVLKTNPSLTLKVTGAISVQDVTYSPAGPQISTSVERVRVDGSHKPLPGVSAQLLTGGKVLTQTVSDGIGQIRFFTTSAGQLQIRFPSEFVAQDGELLVLTLNEVDIYLDPAGAAVDLPPTVYEIKKGRLVGELSGDGNPLEGVLVQLEYVGHGHGKGAAQVDNSANDGSYGFEVTPGDVLLRFPKVFIDAAGIEWELAGEASHLLTVDHTGSIIAQPARYSSAVHAIHWRTVRPDGRPIPGVLVQVRDEVGGERLAEDRTAADGYVYLEVPVGGRYQIWVYEDDRATREPLKLTRDVGSVLEGQSEIADGSMQGSGDDLGGRGSTPGAIQDLSAYPVLTSDVPFPSGDGLGGPPSGQAMGQTVSAEIRNVLGWRWRGATPDPKGFVDVLAQSFNLAEQEGHTVATWVPRTYLVQSDLGGGVSGAQASIYDRAKVAVGAVLPLLKGIYPLRADADPQDSKALQAVIANQAEELLAELGMVGGPRVGRVDQMFRLLLGAGEHTTDPDLVGGQLGTLREEFGLGTDTLVNTVEEEQNTTNYRIVSDYFTGLRLSWLSNRDFFLRDGGKRPFYGTQLVLISRQLAVISDSVDEVRGVMRSVFISDAERETLEIQFKPREDGGGEGEDPEPPAPHPMLIEELLSWVGSFASEEGPRLIQDGGKWAVGTTLVPVARKLSRLARGALDPANGPDGTAHPRLPAGYFTPRVQRALAELHVQLRELVRLTKPISHNIPSQT
jgi:hypothetical protein